MAVHLIGQRTAEVTRLLYYPVLVILLLLLARIAYFDDWGFPKALVVIVGGSFVIVLASAIYLNYVARTVRSEMLSKLRWEELQLTAISNDEGHPQPTRDEVRSLIDQLEGLQVGAYQPFWERPTVRATLLLISGIAITVFKYLPTFP